MAEDDDPEARIQDLERSLEDQAQSSEMGGAQPGGYAYPPAPPPDFYSYGFPQAGRPQGQGGISPKVVLLVAAVLFGVLAIVMAAVTVLSARESSSVGPTFSAPTSEFTPPSDEITPSSAPSKPSSSSAPTTATQAPSAPPLGENLVIFKSGTFACDNSQVTVTGASLNVVITGHCASLRVTGEDTKVTVDTSDTISVSGVGAAGGIVSGSE
jgi:hypothetical protein